MKILEMIGLSSFFRRNGAAKEAELTAFVAERFQEQDTVEVAPEETLPVPECAHSNIPLQETMEMLRDFVNEEKGVSGSRIAFRTDVQGLLRLRIEVRPTDGYKKSSRLQALMRRLSSDVSKQTGIPRNQITVQRSLKIPPPAEDVPQGPSL